MGKRKKHEIFKQEISEAKNVLEDVTYHIRNRTYVLQKVHWALESNNKELAKKEWSNYTNIKDTWNIKVYIYANKIKRLGENQGHILIIKYSLIVN